MEAAPSYVHDLIGPGITIVLAVLYTAWQSKNRESAKIAIAESDEELRAKARVEAEKVLEKAKDTFGTAARKQAEEVFLGQISGALAKWEAERNASGGGYMQLSARDWINIMSAIEKQFNGRYWLANDARAAMKDLREHAEEQTERLHSRISKLGDEMDSKLVRLADELKEKADKE